MVTCTSRKLGFLPKSPAVTDCRVDNSPDRPPVPCEREGNSLSASPGEWPPQSSPCLPGQGLEPVDGKAKVKSRCARWVSAPLGAWRRGHPPQPV